MKSATRSLTIGLLMVIVCTCVAAMGVVGLAQRDAQTQALHQLTVARLVENKLEAQQLESLQLRAQLLADDPAFVEYVAQSLMPSSGASGGVDSASITDQLDERRSGYDVAMVLDNQGKLISTSGLLEWTRASIEQDVLVIQAIHQLKSVSGRWLVDGHVYWVVISPLLRGNTLQGVLVTATKVTNTFPNAIRDFSGTEVQLVYQGMVHTGIQSSGLDSQFSDVLISKSGDILNASGKDGQITHVTAGAQALVVQVMPLQVSNGQAAWVAVAPLTHIDRTMGGESLPLLLGVAGFGLLAALMVIFQWKRTWLPLQQMLDVVERAGSGDAHMIVRVTGSRIVQDLRDQLNRLIQLNV